MIEIQLCVICGQVALFLVDTQGLFDMEASDIDVTTLGALNFLLSSCQCFNVKERIDKVHLDYIFVRTFLYETA